MHSRCNVSLDRLDLCNKSVSLISSRLRANLEHNAVFFVFMAWPWLDLAYGFDLHADFFNDLHRFDPSLSTWTDLSAPADSAPLPRGSTGLAVAGGQLYLFGGETYGNGSLKPPCVGWLI